MYSVHKYINYSNMQMDNFILDLAQMIFNLV